MTRSSRTARPVRALPIDGLAYALEQAAALVVAVQGGRNLTDAFEAVLAAQPDWSDATRGAVRDLAWGTLRDYGRGEAVLRQLLHKPLPEALHALLLVALHRLETRPEQAHTIVDQAVEAAAQSAPGLKGVINGVLRRFGREATALLREADGDVAARWRHPAWWVRIVQKTYPADRAAAALEAGNGRPPMSLRVNRRRASVETVLSALAEAGLAARALDNDAILLARPVPVSALPGFAEGLLSVQDAGAQWAARWLDLAPGQRVLDACAAPGGKSAHILETADVELMALELDAQRARRVRENLTRLGLQATLKINDCRHVEAWWDGRPFDRILADVPCSASGVVRRHPDIKWHRRAEDIAQFAAQQSEILDALWQTLAPGGKMLYVTCSVFPQENGMQIERFARRHADVLRLSIDHCPDQQLLPDAEHDGFYYALLEKRR